jgi:hypothetical protein
MRSTANTTIGIRNSRTCLGNFCTKSRLSEEGLRGLREDKMIVNPFSRQIPAAERSLTCMLSAIACYQ